MTARASESTTLSAELKIIPAAGWVIAVAILLGWFLWGQPALVRHALAKPGGPGLPLSLLQFLLGCAGFGLAIYALLVGYVSADAGRRQMNRLLWTLLVIVIPNVVGFIVYFILRQPIALPCRNCRALVRGDFVFCPACGTALAPACPSCHHAVDAGWVSCAFCGTRLS